ncbi:lysozyme g-like [Scomber japonicus]|uniref:lysozyme g-like n=1 Tax=Scomber japonicus TaxID=13676 RepID=UPI0023061B1D|nr:lysozyme g-like [Scomber japonicus]
MSCIEKSSYPYGDICEVDTTGAPEETADGRKEGRKEGSVVSASREMAKDDFQHIKVYKKEIIKAANKYGVQPSVVAGIISRETRGGRGAGFTSDGWGDNRNTFGLMQIDKNWHKPRGQWDSQEHIEQGVDQTKTHLFWGTKLKNVQILPTGGIKEVRSCTFRVFFKGFLIYVEYKKSLDFFSLHPSTYFFPALGVLAAFNMSTEKMASSYKNVDDHTTEKDYSNDVTARAQYYEEHYKEVFNL